MTTPQTPFELFGIDGLIDATDAKIQNTIRDFTDDHLRPHLTDWYESGDVPVRELAREFGKLGVLGMHLTGYGCEGTSATAYGLACLELEAADSGLRTLVSVQGSLAMYAIHRWGSEEQKHHWLPAMARGEAIGCFALTEPDFGSDPAGMRTYARRDQSVWILTGTKKWITNGSVADVAVVWAHTDDKIRGFLVPTDTPGFSARQIPNKLSLRASVTSELVLDDVRLPESAMLPEAAGLAGPLACLNEARFGIVFGALGAARDSLEATISYTLEREIFGKPLAGYQATQLKLSDMTVKLGTAMMLALQLGRLKDAGQLRPEQISLGKLNSVREALNIARDCRPILGANGITLDYPVLRHANNLESVLTYEGTAEIHQLTIGRALTGQQAFR
ncbi:acyl-CoA dehydrogenase [Rhodococcus sp. ACS1]|uniref:acyl-CoA dehydrogenase family protein n=1 Tax=Rhodococcus sp. ACS1 TaxID=2028570 RepID=UPI000BB163FD|nr:acyl-CoA dehydrogenase family protein [Rhodococcus sp. ACS1]PBC35236.1 acyl-CoA dehydrogenase [Rhodococcus sp. ACS1]